MHRTRQLIVLVAAILSLGAPAPAVPTNALSEWKAGCFIDGRPLNVLSYGCGSGYFTAWFDGSPNDRFFDFGRGAYLTLAIYEPSQGFRLWGPSQFEELGPAEIRGTGVPEDPFQTRYRFAAGDPRRLVIRPDTRYVNGRGTFEVRWEIENVSDEPVHFRATVYADTRAHDYQCAYGEVKDDPLSVGSFTPEKGSLGDPDECSDGATNRGYGAYAVEQRGSPWSAYQQGGNDEILSRISAADGPGLANTHEPRPIPEAVAVQWDDHGRGRPPLAPGATTTFALGWRFTNDLLVTPFMSDSPDDVHRVTFSTRHARGGPQTGRRIVYEIERGHRRKRETITTNRRGLVRVRWKKDFEHTTSFAAGFDSNADGRLQLRTELYRDGMSVTWSQVHDRYRTRLSFDATNGGFEGRVRAFHEKGRFAVDCRSHRTVAIRRREKGRDPTLASAAANERGAWDLTVSAPPGSYYAVAQPEWRSEMTRAPYLCRRARAG